MLTMLGTLITSVLAGGATGLGGVLLQRVFDHLKVKQDLALTQMKFVHELAMRDKDAALMREEWAGRLRVAEREGETATAVAETAAFSASLLREPERYSHAPTLTPRQQWLMVILDFCRGIIRPGLTVYLCALTSYVWWQVRQLLSIEELDQASVLEVWKLVVGTILYLTTTVVLWWFGTRSTQRAPAGLK